VILLLCFVPASQKHLGNLVSFAQNGTKEVETCGITSKAVEAIHEFVDNIEMAEEAHKEQSNDTVAVVEETIAADDTNPGPQNVISFECYFCDFDCVNEENLENHWYEMHKDEFQHYESGQSEKECECNCQL
jgi:hypothetical protein